MSRKFNAGSLFAQNKILFPAVPWEIVIEIVPDFVLPRIIYSY
jgi:hypothetical protein